MARRKARGATTPLTLAVSATLADGTTTTTVTKEAGAGLGAVNVVPAGGRTPYVLAVEGPAWAEGAWEPVINENDGEYTANLFAPPVASMTGDYVFSVTDADDATASAVLKAVAEIPDGWTIYRRNLAAPLLVQDSEWKLIGEVSFGYSAGRTAFLEVRRSTTGPPLPGRQLLVSGHVVESNGATAFHLAFSLEGAATAGQVCQALEAAGLARARNYLPQVKGALPPAPISPTLPPTDRPGYVV